MGGKKYEIYAAAFGGHLLGLIFTGLGPGGGDKGAMRYCTGHPIMSQPKYPLFHFKAFQNPREKQNSDIQ